MPKATGTAEIRPLLLVSALAFGGAEVQTALEANLLDSRGHAVHVVAFADGPVRERLAAHIPVTIITAKGYRARANAVAAIARTHRATHLHCVLFAAKVVGTLAAHQTGLPALWHVHGHRFYDSWRTKAFLQLLSRSPRVKVIAFVANAIAHWHGQQGYYPKRKMQVLYNGLAPPQAVSVRTPPPAFTVGFVGRMVALKRVELLLDSVSALRARGISAQALLLGDGPDLARWQAHSKALRLDAAGAVTWAGFVQNPRDYYARFSVLVLPSSEEAMSLSLLDALREGVPAVAFAVGGNGEIILEGQTGYLVNTPDELTARLEGLATGTVTLPDLPNVAYTHFMAHFTEDAHYQNLVALYRRMA